MQRTKYLEYAAATVAVIVLIVQLVLWSANVIKKTNTGAAPAVQTIYSAVLPNTYINQNPLVINVPRECPGHSRMHR